MNDIVIHNQQPTSLADGHPLDEPRTHVCITYSKVHYQLTAKQYETIMAMSTGDIEWCKRLGLPAGAAKSEQIVVAGNLIKFSDIASIITMDKYRESFPEKNVSYGQPYTEVETKSLTERLFEGDFMDRMIESLEKDYEKNPTEGRRRQLVSFKERKRLRDMREKQKKGLDKTSATL